MTLIISGFPGIGKTYCANRWNNISDSDSSKFSWLSPGVRHPDFPTNYIDHILQTMGMFDTIMVSSHKVVRDALVESGLRFTLIYPERESLQDWLTRCLARGSDFQFVMNLARNWNLWMDELDEQVGCSTVQLKSGEFLSDWLVKFYGGYE